MIEKLCRIWKPITNSEAMNAPYESNLARCNFITIYFDPVSAVSQSRTAVVQIQPLVREAVATCILPGSSRDGPP